MLKRITAAILCLALLFSLSGCGGNGYQKYEDTFFGVFDTVVLVTGYTKTKEEFEGVTALVKEDLTRYSQLFDIYNTYSGMNNLKTINDNAGIAPVKVDETVIELLKACKTYYKQSGGEVNVAFGSVLSIWHDYREAAENDEQEAQLPPMDKLKAAAEHTNIDDMIINEAESTVFLRDAAMQLDVGAVAKGYATQLVANRLKESSAESFVISAGGNVAAIGKPMDGRDRWGIGVENPKYGDDATAAKVIDNVFVSDLSVVCSGDYQRFYTVDGKRYHHIIDPQTLYPGERYSQVTILCADSGAADFLSTALFLMDRTSGEALLSQYGAEAIYIDKDGNKSYTSGMRNYAESLGATAKN